MQTIKFSEIPFFLTFGAVCLYLFDFLFYIIPILIFIDMRFNSFSNQYVNNNRNIKMTR